jgi:hypothetical protein
MEGLISSQVDAGVPLAHHRVVDITWQRERCFLPTESSPN